MDSRKLTEGFPNNTTGSKFSVKMKKILLDPQVLIDARFTHNGSNIHQ